MNEGLYNGVYFALWAEDINRYLGTGYNKTTIREIRKALIDYVSVDTDNPANIDEMSFSNLLGMTGLELDCLPFPFKTKNDIDEEPTSTRVGSKVNSSLIANM